MPRARSDKPLSCKSRSETGRKCLAHRSGAECRRLKVKCDLAFPCSYCVKRGLAHLCPDGELVQGARGQRILAGTEVLHARIAALETALQEATSTTPAAGGRISSSDVLRQPSDAPARTGTDATLTLSPLHQIERTPSWYARSSTQPASASRPSDPPLVPEATDRLASYSHLVLEEDAERTRYFGAASSVYLTQRRAAPSSTATPSASALPHIFDLPVPGSTGASTIRSDVSSAEVAQQFLPPEPAARRLADLYFKTFGWFTNIVPERTWESKLFQHVYGYETGSTPHPQRLTVVLLVLALGSVMEGSRTASDTTRDLIVGARLSLSLDSSHSVTLVQILYLYVTFIMNGKKDTAGGEVGWPFLRAGMMVAEAIGLHRDPEQWDLDPAAATERRIIFWEIHGYDVLQSIALGRGQCIADYAIDCAYPDDGDETGFHCQTYALTRIWSRINERQIRISPSTYTDVCQINDALDEYHQALPLHLSLNAPPPSLIDLADPGRRRLAFRRNMLLMYVTEARMALHRGWFVRALREHPLEPLQSPQQQSFVVCLEACRTLITLVRNVLALQDQQIHRRWHFFFHLFSACACLAACAIRAPSSSLAPAVLSELEQGIELFRAAQRDETPQLERLKDYAVQAVREGHSGNQTEDLDLIGAHKTLRRSPAVLTALTASEPFVLPSIDHQQPQTFDFTFDPGNETAMDGFAAATGEFDMNAFLQELGLLP